MDAFFVFNHFDVTPPGLNCFPSKTAASIGGTAPRSFF